VKQHAPLAWRARCSWFEPALLRLAQAAFYMHVNHAILSRVTTLRPLQ